MRRAFLWIAVAVAIIAAWQWLRTSPRSKAAPLHKDSVAGSSPPEAVRVPAKPIKPVQVDGAVKAVKRGEPGTPAILEVGADQRTLPKDVSAKFAKIASSYIPPQQRSNPGIMGRIMGMRLRMFNEELVDQEPDSKWTKAMQERLEKAFALVPDSHLLSVDCRETTCKVEVIHEDDERALDFNDLLPSSPVTPAFKDDFVSFIERDETDGQLKNTVFIERDGPGLRQKLAEALGLDDGDDE